MAELFGIPTPPSTPTGVDVDFFQPQEAMQQSDFDLMFLGAMDWMPDSDGMRYFVRETLPLTKQLLPDVKLAIVGRPPDASLQALQDVDGFTVTGTVPDVHSYLWSSKVSIVPLRIGGGTRLKICEAMAAKRPVVSTSIGAEGLEIHPPGNIRIAAAPTAFADYCVELLSKATVREGGARAGFEMVRDKYSWE